MKVTNIQYLSLDDVDKNLNLAKLDTTKTLIQIFSGFVQEDEIKQLQSIIKKKNSEVMFIGTTTAGEIYEGAVYEQSINISIMEFEATTLKEGYFIDSDDFHLGQRIAKALFTPDTKAAILFIDGLKTNGNDVIDGISSINKNIPLAGGLAGDNGYLKQTLIFDGNGVYSKGVVGVSFNSEILHLFTDYQLNWQAIGKTMRVTKVQKNRLYEIDGINVSTIYKKYLGEKIGNNLPFSASEFPLLKIEKNGLEICRVFTHQFDDGSLLTIGNLEVGDKVRLAFGNVDLILQNTKEKIEKYHSFQPEAIFIYSCTARKAFLQSEIVTELEPFNRIAPNIGFFTYGEIYHTKNKNALLNISLTMLALSEKREIAHPPSIKERDNKKEPEKNLITGKHFLVLEALTHLSNSVIAELQEAQEQLKDQANRDYLTGLYNRRYFNEIAQDLIHISQREKKTFCVIMLDIDKFKNINDTYGHGVGDEIIKALSHTLITTVRKSDIVSRYGGEEFALLLPFTDRNGALKIAEKTRQRVQEYQMHTEKGEIIHFTISLGVTSILNRDRNIEDALNRADEALYEAKNSGRNRVEVK